ncbi:MAG: OmpA family protein, partial [Spirochaetota bacterium]
LTYTTVVDGIYSDPIVTDQVIYYGTRNMFLSRETRNGHVKWDNREIKSYSGFPTFYDEYVITQSMNYQTNIYTVHCLKSDTGKEVWAKRVPKPIKIFPPVVYEKKVFIPSGSTIYCLDISSGNLHWQKEYGKIITSHPTFTDRSVIFAADNSTILITNPNDGSLKRSIEIGPRTSPHFVMVRDHLYVAYNRYTKSGKAEIANAYAKAVNIIDGSTIWEYSAPFPGGISQPVAANGILFLPAGKYLYAIGEEYYGGNNFTGSEITTLPPGNTGTRKAPLITPENTQKIKDKSPEKEFLKTRDLKLEINDNNGSGLNAKVEIKKRKDGRIVYHKKVNVNKNGTIQVPEGDDVELLVDSDEYVPKKVILTGKENNTKITLDRLEKGKGFVVDNIHFNFDKWYLKKESLDILDKIVIIMKRNNQLELEVRGHTDSTGDTSYNQQLSEKRADAVIEYMVKNGISPVRLKAVGLGESKPIASNKSLEGRRKNRRTEFFFLK